MLTQSEDASGNYSRARRFIRVTGFALATVLLVACGDPTGPTVKLHLLGTATYHGVPLAGATVVLRDQRSVYDPGFQLGSAITDATGNYEMQVQTGRPGYDAVCDYLYLLVSIDGGGLTTASAPIRCVTDPQTIDLTASSFFSFVERNR